LEHNFFRTDFKNDFLAMGMDISRAWYIVYKVSTVEPEDSQ
jgi:hypothetical protein